MNPLAKKLFKIIQTILRIKFCEECGTTKGLVDCWLFNYETGKEQHWTYCVDCAPKQGFCWACGQFWGGVESFDFGPGYCENCASEIEEEEEYYEEYEEGCYPDEYEEEFEEER